MAARGVKPAAAACRYHARPPNRWRELRRRLMGSLHGRLLSGATTDGLELYFEPRSLTKVRESLELLKEVDPLSWTRLQRYMPLLVETIDGSFYADFVGTGFIDVSRRGKWSLACVIVHELSHAYLHARWS